MSWLHFLKSEEVTKRIARDVLAYLAGNGVKVEGRVQHLIGVAADDRWAGTYTVVVRLPGVTRHYPGGREISSRPGLVPRIR